MWSKCSLTKLIIFHILQICLLEIAEISKCSSSHTFTIFWTRWLLHCENKTGFSDHVWTAHKHIYSHIHIHMVVVSFIMLWEFMLCVPITAFTLDTGITLKKMIETLRKSLEYIFFLFSKSAIAYVCVGITIEWFRSYCSQFLLVIFNT